MVDFQVICFTTEHALFVVAFKDFPSPTAA